MLGSVATGFQDPDLVRLRTEIHLQGASPEALVAYNAANRAIDLSQLLPRLTVPTLVVHEPAFPFGSFHLCQEVAAAIPGAEFMIVGDNSIAGRVHDETVEAIDRFLRQRTATPSIPMASERAVEGRNGERLTPREREVLRHVAGGATNKEIAIHLGLAVSTIERHLVNLYTKIGARGRADAIGYALRHHIY